MDEKHLVSLLIDPVTRREVFGKIVNLYSENVYWQVRRIVLVHEDADDVVQNTFVKAWNALDSFKGESKVSTWLYRIAINESLDFMRHKKALSTVSADDAEGNVVNMLMADKYFDGDETQAMLLEAVSRLPEVQRTVFSLRYFDEMKYSEMSSVLGTSEGALKASYHIAVKKLTEYFKAID